ncbi:hypothetical protein HN51_016479, partial [Arachis hypogaea]
MYVTAFSFGLYKVPFYFFPKSETHHRDCSPPPITMFRHTHHSNDNDNNPPYPPPGPNSLHNPHQPPSPPQPQPHPPFYGAPQPPPSLHEPVPQVYHASHQAPPPPNPYGHPSPAPAPAPAPSLGSVHHVSHTNQSPSPNVRHVSHESHLPPNRADFASPVSGTVHHVSHQSGGGAAGGSATVSNKNIVKVVTKADPNYCVTIRGGKVILAYSDPSDEYQRWYKDLKYSTRVKDEEGYPAFSLVNKVTGEAIKHSVGATHPVQLIHYNPDVLDESVLWTESKDLGDGHRAIRMVNNIRLNVDAYQGDKRSGGVHDGTTIVLWEWNNGDNQHWKIIPN